MNFFYISRFSMIALLSLSMALSGCGVNEVPVDSRPADQPVNPLPDSGEPNTNNDSSNQKETFTLHVEPEQLVLGSNMNIELKTIIKKERSNQTITSQDGVSYHSDNPEVATVNQNGIVHVANEAVTGQSAIITVSYQDQTVEKELLVKNTLENTIAASANGMAVVSNPHALDVVVNKQRSLPADFVPPNLVQPDVAFSFTGNSEKKYLQQEAATALEELFAAAKQDNITLYAVSGYRSYATQKSIFNSNVARQGEEEASRFSARPGHSEHQTGLTMDVTGTDPKCLLEQCFENTPEGKWVAENAHLYGFILRYPKDKEEITGYAFEPWHLRYVGTELAREINELDTTMEQYFTDAIPVVAPSESK